MGEKNAVMYGAGNIGRGFIGQLLFESGYDTTFIDVDEEVVSELNRRGEYPLRILGADSLEDLQISRVSAVNGRQTEAVAEAITQTDLMATAVGANILPHIAGPIAKGLFERYSHGGAPLDILVCENLMHAGSHFRELVMQHLPEENRAWFLENVGFVETSIGRMVPIQTPELRDGDPMRVCVEAYSKLPVDKEGFKAGIPELRGLVPYAPFSFYVERKLYIHNMGHALAAYCGSYLNCEYIWQALAVPMVAEIVKNAMLVSADALAARYQADPAELREHVLDLLDRFQNKRLGDTVYRVGRDIKRKLAAEDRMIGALSLSESQGTDNGGIYLGVALALRFPGEDLAMSPEEILTEVCGLKAVEKKDTIDRILSMYRLAQDGTELSEIMKITM